MATLTAVALEAYRSNLMRGLERLLWTSGFERVAGVDEAGRGALAGPVVAAAVIPDPSLLIPGVDDSKALDAVSRERLAELIRRTSLASAVVAVSPQAIDGTDILRATRVAMTAAVGTLVPYPDVAVVDAVWLRGLSCRCLAVIRGDQISYAVACASIIAKVERDRMMIELDREYPAYGFAAHKGYAAPEHLRALVGFGPCREHRLTFRRVLPRRDDPAVAAGGPVRDPSPAVAVSPAPEVLLSLPGGR